VRLRTFEILPTMNGIPAELPGTVKLWMGNVNPTSPASFGITIGR
jgi:hypothetical protein